MSYLVLDTNIPLLDATNILTVGGPDTVIVIPETVLAELDAKKGGFDEINFQAREFARLTETTTIVRTHQNGPATITEVVIEGVRIDIAMLEQYKNDADTYGGNDRRIIEVAKFYSSKYPNVTLMTNDIYMKFQGVAADIDTTSLKVVDEAPAVYVKEFKVDSPEVFRLLHKADVLSVDPDYEVENYSYKFTCANTNQVKLATVHNGFIEVLGKDTEKALKLQLCAPINF